MNGMNDLPGRPSTSSLVADAMAQMARLVETEIRLVRTELGEKLAEAITAMAVIAVSAVLLLASVILLLIGLVHLIIWFGVLPFIAYFAVGLAAIVLGGIAVYFAVSRLSPSGLTPKRALKQIGKDARAIREQVS